MALTTAADGGSTLSLGHLTPAEGAGHRPADVAAAPARPWPAAPPGSAAELAGLRFSVVPHTHWDREWYLPLEQMRMRLAQSLDQVMDVLDADPEFRAFTLDGQAVILEDYAILRPHRVAQLRRLLETGRLVAGPGYVAPDEFLASGEALVRNLLIGMRTVESFGGRPMHVGYHPDAFGHVAQLPQILGGFGIDAFLFWRGLGDEADGLGAIFEWVAPDGTPVIAIRQLGGYANADELGRWSEGGVGHHDQPGDWPAVAADRFPRLLRQWGAPLRRSGIPELLLCQGGDHRRAQPDTPALVAHAREAHPGLQAEITTYEAYVDRTRPYLPRLASLSGEMRGARETAVLRGVDSARLRLKRAYADAERDLLVAEAMASLAALARRASPPLPELDRAWRLLLQTLPHDSITGCSTDEVHREMETRFASVRQLADRVRREALAALAATDEPWRRDVDPATERAVVNPLPWTRSLIARIPIPARVRDAARRGRMAAFVDGLPVAAQVMARATAVAVPVRLGSFGSRRVTLASGSTAARPPVPGAVRACGERGLENDHVRVEVERDGTLTITDRATGRRAPGQAGLEDVGDRGDEYTFDPVPDDRPIGPSAIARVRCLADGPLVGELEVALDLRLPAGLTADRRRRSRRPVRVRVRLVVRLEADSPSVGLEVTWDNRVRDHRLRMLFRSPDAGDTLRSEGHFTVLERPVGAPEPAQPWIEAPVATHHTCGAVAAGSLSVTGTGLPEVEPVRIGDALDVAVTLLRSVGWLSRDDLVSRPGGAGPSIPTPGAQGFGVHHARLAVRLDGPLEDAALVRWSQEERFGVVLGPAAAVTSGLLEPAGASLAFAALKPAEDGDGVVLRLWNATAGPAQLGLPGSLCDVAGVALDEHPSELRPTAAGMVGPREIVTVKIAT